MPNLLKQPDGSYVEVYGRTSVPIAEVMRVSRELDHRKFKLKYDLQKNSPQYSLTLKLSDWQPSFRNKKDYTDSSDRYRLHELFHPDPWNYLEKDLYSSFSNALEKMSGTDCKVAPDIRTAFGMDCAKFNEVFKQNIFHYIKNQRNRDEVKKEADLKEARAFFEQLDEESKLGADLSDQPDLQGAAGGI